MPAPARNVVHSDIKQDNPPERAAHYVDAPNMPWEKTKFPGIQIKVLFTDGNGITTAAQLMAGATVSNGNTVLHLSSTNDITLLGIPTPASLLSSIIVS